MVEFSNILTFLLFLNGVSLYYLARPGIPDSKWLSALSPKQLGPTAACTRPMVFLAFKENITNDSVLEIFTSKMNKLYFIDTVVVKYKKWFVMWSLI